MSTFTLQGALGSQSLVFQIVKDYARLPGKSLAAQVEGFLQMAPDSVGRSKDGVAMHNDVQDLREVHLYK